MCGFLFCCHNIVNLFLVLIPSNFCFIHRLTTTIQLDEILKLFLRSPIVKLNEIAKQLRRLFEILMQAFAFCDFEMKIVKGREKNYLNYTPKILFDFMNFFFHTKSKHGWGFVLTLLFCAFFRQVSISQSSSRLQMDTQKKMRNVMLTEPLSLCNIVASVDVFYIFWGDFLKGIF